jgi:hypothetical protein
MVEMDDAPNLNWVIGGFVLICLALVAVLIYLSVSLSTLDKSESVLRTNHIGGIIITSVVLVALSISTKVLFDINKELK